MARATQKAKSTKPADPLRKTSRPETKGAKSSAKVNKVVAAPRRTSIAAPAIPKPSKDELRAQAEKLETIVATLRAKNREANRAAKAAAARIAELEEQLAQLEKKVSRAVSTKRGSKIAAPTAGKRKIDPGDAVPPGVAVPEPAALDEGSQDSAGEP